MGCYEVMDKVKATIQIISLRVDQRCIMGEWWVIKHDGHQRVLIFRWKTFENLDQVVQSENQAEPGFIRDHIEFIVLSLIWVLVGIKNIFE